MIIIFVYYSYFFISDFIIIFTTENQPNSKNSMKKIILSLLCLFIAGVVSADEFIGKTLDEQLVSKIAGVKLILGQGAVAIDGENESYVVNVYETEKSPITVIALEKSTNEGKTCILVDYLIVDKSKLGAKSGATMGSSQKYDDNGNVNHYFLAYYDPNQTDKTGDSVQYFTNIYKAWSVDGQNLKLIEMPTKGLKLLNECY